MLTDLSARDCYRSLCYTLPLASVSPFAVNGTGGLFVAFQSAASLERIQGRGGRARQIFARRRGVFLAILTFLTGFVTGRSGEEQWQRQRRLHGLRRRREELEPANTCPERGEALTEWTSSDDASTLPRSPRSRSPLPKPKPSQALSWSCPVYSVHP